MKNILLAFFALLTTTLFAQSPIKWTFEAKCLDPNNGEYLLVFDGEIKEGWNTYSQYLESEDGPVPTTFEFAKGAYTKIGKCEESGGKETSYDDVFKMTITKFKHHATFSQKVKVTDASKPISGYLSFICCDATHCMPPKDIDFMFKLPNCVGNTVIPAVTPGQNTTVAVVPDPKSGGTTIENPEGTKDTTKTIGEPSVNPHVGDSNWKGEFVSKRAEIDVNNPINKTGGTKEDSGLLSLFLIAFASGFIALLTPCVFPMIPLTVSFFTKSSGSKSKGIRNAIIYGLSIIVIYLLIGIIVTLAFGPNTLNAMATNPWINTAFFVIFIVFAFSFFGYYEITLPSSWSTSTDKAADKGGLLGIFFMAFTLALVSFSCTGPIIGSLLVQTVSGGQDMLFGVLPIRPLVGMFGFSFALALPFALFAMFPSWLNSLPKSGGWMNAVKVTLGFLELAFALKFLSTADLVAHWGWLRWELFIGLWILIFAGLALYHFGKIRFPHDSPMKKMSTGNWALALGSTAMAIYLCFGFQYKPLGVLSGLAPSYTYNYYGPKGGVHGLEVFHDYDEAVKHAKEVGKPIFVDFTGYGCVNCRKMEENVWVYPEILKYLKDDYVVVSLYVDDEARLFGEDKFSYLSDSNAPEEKIRTVGSKWSAFQRNNFNEASQPQYILMNNDGTTVLANPKGYTPDVEEYNKFLQIGLDAFKTVKK
jgi:thiol:disulfide interchange protein